MVRLGAAQRAPKRKNAIPIEALSDPNHLIVASAFYSALEDMAVALDDPHFCANVAQDAALRGVPTLRESVARATSLDDFLVGANIQKGTASMNRHYLTCLFILIASTAMFAPPAIAVESIAEGQTVAWWTSPGETDTTAFSALCPTEDRLSSSKRTTRSAASAGE